MGLFSRGKPKIKVQTTKKDSFSGWVQCSGCKEMVHASEMQRQINCCPKCGYHYRLSLPARISLLADENTYQELFTNIRPIDSLSFVDTEKYQDRLEQAQQKTGRDDAISAGICQIGNIQTCLAVLDFSFMGGSMGSVVGERLTLLIEKSIEERLPLVVVSASGGARMQESILSLMQMAKTSAALARLHDAGVPYISILTNPTTGGVTASFATLGDIIIAEPDALIAFAGPRVVEQVIGQKLPPKAQKAEFLLEKGMVDMVVERCELKKRLVQLLSFLTRNERTVDSDSGNELAQKMSLRLKELLNHALEKDAKESSPTSSYRSS